jgi:hypothetical protein
MLSFRCFLVGAAACWLTAAVAPGPLSFAAGGWSLVSAVFISTLVVAAIQARPAPSGLFPGRPLGVVGGTLNGLLFGTYVLIINGLNGRRGFTVPWAMSDGAGGC